MIQSSAVITKLCDPLGTLQLKQSNFNGSNIFGTIEKNFWDMGSHWGLIMASVQEAKSENLGILFYFIIELYIECTHYNRIDEVILMSTHNIQFHDKIRKKISKYLFSWAIGRIL